MAKTQDEFKVATNIKIGDIVEVRDGSWAFGVSIKGEKVNICGFDLFNKQFKVTYLSQNNCDTIPADTEYNKKPRYNNTILQDVDNGDIIFTDSDYLKVIKPIDCPCDRCNKCDTKSETQLMGEFFRKFV